MNKRYIDFVPVKGAEKVDTKVATSVATNEARVKPVAMPARTAPSSAGTKKVARPQPARAVAKPEFDVTQVMAERHVAGVSASKRPRYGVVEDYRPKFVQTEVKKRPLSKQAMRDTLTDAKQKKIVKRPLETVAEKVETLSEREPRASKAVAKKQAKLLKMPRVPFVNTDKIAKRPLSKNVYKKKVVVPKEEPSGPTTIIEKPEKDSKVGMVVAIILTIILGAAAGTVAFLLLPK
ncbi:hypothetical protein IJH33_00030 [Candidatus Saccharibacteria bacterium]|nr:hypothetical protein [Candidatus Saccharibacteria bacterium]